MTILHCCPNVTGLPPQLSKSGSTLAVTKKALI